MSQGDIPVSHEDAGIPGADTNTYTVENITTPLLLECVVTDQYGNQAKKSFRIEIETAE